MTEQTREAVENYLRNADKKPGESTYHDATTFTKYCRSSLGITVIDEPAFLYQEAPASSTRCCRDESALPTTGAHSSPRADVQRLAPD